MGRAPPLPEDRDSRDGPDHSPASLGAGGLPRSVCASGQTFRSPGVIVLVTGMTIDSFDATSPQDLEFQRQGRSPLIGRSHIPAPGQAPALAAVSPTGEAAARLSAFLGRCLDVLRVPGQVTAGSEDGGVQGLTRRQVRVVRNLPREGLTLAELSQRLDLGPASVLALADQLVRSGAARRERASGDPYTVRLLPTASGVTMAEACLGHQEVAIARLVARLPASALSALAGSGRALSVSTGSHRPQSPLERSPAQLRADFQQTSNGDRALRPRRSQSRGPLAGSSATPAGVGFGDRATPLGVPAGVGPATCGHPGDPSLVEAVGPAAALSS